MKVGYGSKVRNLIGFALKKIKEAGVSKVCWTGHGKAFNKTLSCAEIFRSKVKGLHKVTNLRYKRTEEYWEPKLEGLDRLRVNIDVPAVTVLFTKEKTEQPHQSWPKELEVLWRNSLKDCQKQQPSGESCGDRKRENSHRKDTDSKDPREKIRSGKQRQQNSPRTSANKDRALRENDAEEVSKTNQKKSSGHHGVGPANITNDRKNSQSESRNSGGVDRKSAAHKVEGDHTSGGKRTAAHKVKGNNTSGGKKTASRNVDGDNRSGGDRTVAHIVDGDRDNKSGGEKNAAHNVHGDKGKTSADEKTANPKVDSDGDNKSGGEGTAAHQVNDNWDGGKRFQTNRGAKFGGGNKRVRFENCSGEMGGADKTSGKRYSEKDRLSNTRRDKT